MKLLVDGAERHFDVEVVVVIGYAGRDREAVEAHISELAELGVPRPAQVPLFMAFPPWLLTQAPVIKVAGHQTSGEVELVMVVDGNDMFVTVGSDHTDRALEAVDIVASKGVCPKPVATNAWAASEMGDQWDDLTLSSFIDGNVTYQQGSVGANLPPDDLVASIPWRQDRPKCFAAFTGTVGVIGEIRPSQTFKAQLTAPNHPPIQLTYKTTPIPPLAN